MHGEGATKCRKPSLCCFIWSGLFLKKKGFEWSGEMDRTLSGEGQFTSLSSILRIITATWLLSQPKKLDNKSSGKKAFHKVPQFCVCVHWVSIISVEEQGCHAVHRWERWEICISEITHNKIYRLWNTKRVERSQNLKRESRKDKKNE